MVAKEAFAIIGYATCSSLMLIMNKIAVHVLPAPSFVLLMQFVASWLAVKLCGMCGLGTSNSAQAAATRTPPRRGPWQQWLRSCANQEGAAAGGIHGMLNVGGSLIVMTTRRSGDGARR